MAGGLDLQVLAEGVETEEQVRFLKARNCHQSQGFYFSPPMPAEDLETHFIHPLENQPIRR
jgi:EAL domain-containing protein (putative c-di-GMP-specific phosphodiesterase class I)